MLLAPRDRCGWQRRLLPAQARWPGRPPADEVLVVLGELAWDPAQAAEVGSSALAAVLLAQAGTSATTPAHENSCDSVQQRFAPSCPLLHSHEVGEGGCSSYAFLAQ